MKIIEKRKTMKFIHQVFAAIMVTCVPLMSHAQIAEIPAITTFNVGDKWEWRRLDNRTNVEEGRSTRTVVKVDGILKFSSERGNRQISQDFLGKPSVKPWRVWPLEVGKKWEYEEDWLSKSGTPGNTQQNVEVVGYEEITVPAGKFMAFKIEHKGWYRRNGGSGGKQTEVYWYAPEAKTNVKRTFDDGYDSWTEELLIYKRAAP
jgi:hypothetical protein